MSDKTKTITGFGHIGPLLELLVQRAGVNDLEAIYYALRDGNGAMLLNEHEKSSIAKREMVDTVQAIMEEVEGAVGCIRDAGMSSTHLRGVVDDVENDVDRALHESKEVLRSLEALAERLDG